MLQRQGSVQGKQIEGTFWRDMADKMDSELVEGRVYYFSNGSVLPSNRKFSTVDNDYKINFNEGKSEVKLAEVQVPLPLQLPAVLYVLCVAAVPTRSANDVQDADKMKARCVFVKIDCLAGKLARKVPVDVVAVVTAVAPLGSVKRQSDGTEFNRRCVCLPLSLARAVRSLCNSRSVFLHRSSGCSRSAISNLILRS